MKYDIFLLDTFLLEKQVNEWVWSKTIATYTTVFNVLLSCPYLSLDNLATFTELNFKRFLGEALIKNKWTSWTYNRYRKNLKVFCDYLISNGLLFENPLKKIKIRKVDKILPKFFNASQIDLILYMLVHLFPDESYKHIRNRTIIYTYLFTGMRLYELINLQYSHINFEEGYLKVVRGKGQKDRFVPICQKLEWVLLTYREARKHFITNTPNFFVTCFGWVLQHREVYGIINKLKAKLDFPLTCHMFRHTFATELCRKNVNLFNIASILGHSKIDTTKIYLNFNMDSMKETLDDIDMFS